MNAPHAACDSSALPAEATTCRLPKVRAAARRSKPMHPASTAAPSPATTTQLCNASLGQPAFTAPISGWRRAALDTLATAAAASTSHALGALASLLLRTLLRPEQMGIWQGVKLLLTYANYANLGASKGAARELARARGNGGLAQAAQDVDLAFTVNTLSSLAYATLVAMFGLWLACAGSGPWHFAWGTALLAAAVLVPVQRHLTFHVTLLRSQQAFRTTAWVTVLDAALALLVGGAGAYLGGVLGLCLATLAAMLLTQTYLWRSAPVCLRWRWHTQGVMRIVRLGAPLLAGGVAASLFRSLDRLAILACLPNREAALGLYSTALLVSSQIYGFSNLLSTAMGPRYAELFGRAGDRRAVARMAALATEWQACALGLLGGLAVVLGQPLLGTLLPAYRAGLDCLALVAAGSVFLGLAVPASQYQAAVYEERRGLWLTCVFSLLAAVGDAAVLLAGLGLSGLAAMTAVTYLGYYALLVATTIWRHLDAHDRLRLVGAHVLLLVPPLSVACWLAASNRRASLTWALLHAGLTTAVWLASSAAGWCWGGWQKAWRQEHRP